VALSSKRTHALLDPDIPRVVAIEDFEHAHLLAHPFDSSVRRQKSSGRYLRVVRSPRAREERRWLRVVQTDHLRNSD
jgi:hypothetical protein